MRLQTHRSCYRLVPFITLKKKIAILDLFVSKTLVQVHKQKTSVFQDILVLLTEIGFYVVHQ